MQQFLMPLIGGVLIGLSAIFFMYSLGKIAGISGVVWRALSKAPSSSDRFWPWLFILGLPIGTLLAHAIGDITFPTIHDAPIRAAIAGLFVGVGVKLGNGCTSGHGVCGISRFSIRSLVATLTFMLTAIVTVAMS